MRTLRQAMYRSSVDPDFRAPTSIPWSVSPNLFVDFVNGPSKFVNPDELEGLESEMVKFTNSIHFYNQIFFLRRACQ